MTQLPHDSVGIRKEGNDESVASKRTYKTPTLKRFGDVRALTGAAGTTSANRDVPGGPPNKTA